MIDKKDVIESLYQRLINLKQEEGKYIHAIDTWEWQQGVALYAIYKLYKTTKENRYLDYINDWFTVRIENGIPHRNVNTTAPFLTMAFLTQENDELSKKYIPYIQAHAKHIIEKFPRTLEGGLQHSTLEYIHREQIWSDTIFMTVLFLAKAGKLLNDKTYIDEAIYQILLHIKYLVEPTSGLYRHGWSFLPEHKDVGKVLWARGNSWITMGIPELIDILDDEITSPVKRILVNAYKKQVDALIKLQSNDGIWSTVLDDNESYGETSSTAVISAGIMKGISLGILDAHYGLNAFMGIRYVIDNYWDISGDLSNVSYGTPIGTDKGHYINIPFCQAPYGQASMIFALLELKDVKGFEKGFTMPWKEK